MKRRDGLSYAMHAMDLRWFLIVSPTEEQWRDAKDDNTGQIDCVFGNLANDVNFEWVSREEPSFFGM